MPEQSSTIRNRRGLHARAAGKLVQTAARFQSSVTLIAKGREVNARSILGVMMLAAGLGTPVTLRADGSDAEAALEALIDLINRGFDEED
ncbi:MAG: HPr family phosphocarrier protein [Xanthomonadales bacterium]|jgi:phosphocarrier protein|nr:HPr family phosphocarrier protein [Xanthomonadales bacterium]